MKSWSELDWRKYWKEEEERRCKRKRRDELNPRIQAAKQAAAKRKRRKEEDRFLQSMLYRYWHEELLNDCPIYDTTKRREDLARFFALTGRTIEEAYKVVVQVHPIKLAEQVRHEA